DAINPRETQAAVARTFGGEERLENARHDFFGGASAIIRDFYTDGITWIKLGGAVLSRLGQFEIAGLNRDAAAIRNGFDGVFKNFDEGLLHFGFVEVGGKKFAFLLLGNRDGRKA